MAEKFAKIQRRGKLEKEVVQRWEAIFDKWWNELTSYADANKVSSYRGEKQIQILLLTNFHFRTKSSNFMNG